MKARKIDYSDMRLKRVDKSKIVKHITWRTKASNRKLWLELKEEEKEE